MADLQRTDNGTAGQPRNPREQERRCGGRRRGKRKGGRRKRRELGDGGRDKSKRETGVKSGGGQKRLSRREAER